MSRAPLSLKDRLAQHEETLKSGNPKPRGIFLCSSEDRSSPFVRAVMRCGSATGNRMFTNLNECMLEALDEPPLVMVFDVLEIDAIVHAHIERLRTAPEGRDVAIVIRASKLSEADVVSLTALEVNHLAMTFGPVTPIVDEVKRLLTSKTRRQDLSRTAATLAHKISGRIDIPTESNIPDQLVTKFELHYGFRLQVTSGGGAVKGIQWGVIPASTDVVGICAIRFLGKPASMQRHAKRFTGLMSSQGLDAASPARLACQLVEHLQPYLLAGESGNFACVSFDRRNGAIRALSSGGVLVSLDGSPAELVAGVAPLSAGLNEPLEDLVDREWRLRRSGMMALPLGVNALQIGEIDQKPPSDLRALARRVRKDAPWLGLEFLRGKHVGGSDAAA